MFKNQREFNKSGNYALIGRHFGIKNTGCAITLYIKCLIFPRPWFGQEV